jgi:hypothetical protein
MSPIPHVSSQACLHNRLIPTLRVNTPQVQALMKRRRHKCNSLSWFGHAVLVRMSQQSRWHRPNDTNVTASQSTSSRAHSSTYRNLPINPSVPVIPVGIFLLIPSRPRRRSRQKSLNPEPTKSYGNPIIQKADSTVRLFFQNVKGLSSSYGSEDYRYYLNCLQSFQVDFAGLAETNAC